MNQQALENLAYHYTDTARLPFIIESGVLLPGRNKIGDFPNPDFLWATTSSLGDRTASASVEACRAGRVRLARFILPVDAFEPWHVIVTRFPAWTPEHVRNLEKSASGKSRPHDWRCRATPLPIEQCLGIETRSYTDKAWRPLQKPWLVVYFGHNSLGITIGNKVFVSTCGEDRFGSTNYMPVVLEAKAAA